MNKQKGFLLRLPQEERERAKQLAKQLGYSENRLYNELIHDALLMREQIQYFQQLKNAHKQASKEQVLQLLDRVPDITPEPEDKMPAAQ